MRNQKWRKGYKWIAMWFHSSILIFKKKKKRKYSCKTVTNFPFYFHFINSDPLSKIPKFYCIRILTQNNLYHKTKFSRTVKYKSPIFFDIIPLNNNPKFNYEQLLPEIIINV